MLHIPSSSSLFPTFCPFAASAVRFITIVSEFVLASTPASPAAPDIRDMQNEAAQVEPKKLTKAEKAKATQACVRYAGLVRSIAKQYVRPGCDLEDLIQIGYFGLMKAVADWREDGGSSFVTIANLRIRDQLRVAVSRDALTESVSLDQDPGGTDEGDSGNTLHDLIGEDGDQEETVEANEIRDNVQRALHTLSAADQALLGDLADDVSTRAAETKTGVPHETIRDRRRSAVTRLGNALASTYSPPTSAKLAS